MLELDVTGFCNKGDSCSLLVLVLQHNRITMFFMFLLGEASGESVPAKVQALAGEAVVLPCKTNAGDLPAIEWSKEGLAPRRIILAYRNGRDVHAEKNALFHYRTSLIMDELKHGNISLRISSVQLTDAGKYICRTIRNQVPKDITVQLSVGTSSRIDFFYISCWG